MAHKAFICVHKIFFIFDGRNYYSNRLNNMINLMRDQERVQSLGIESGLSVILDPLLDDYFYSILPIKGWKVSENDIIGYFN